MLDNPWHRLREEPPYVLPEDEAAIRQFNSSASDTYKLRVDEFLPEPFVGDPKAPVVVLGNNPGYTEQGAPRRGAVEFVTRMRANLRHETSDWPFVFFDPNVDEGNRKWWNTKLKGLLHFGHDVLAKSIFAVELFPYASCRFRIRRLRLPSKAELYSYSLVQAAIERDAVIVITRGRKKWFEAVKDLANYPYLCELKNKRKGGITPGNCDRFAEVQQAIADSLRHR